MTIGTTNWNSSNWGLQSMYSELLAKSVASGVADTEATYGFTGSTIDVMGFTNKTIYISAGTLDGAIWPTLTQGIGSGMTVNIEGTYGDSNEFYTIWRSNISEPGKYYYSFNEYHPYIRARISGLGGLGVTQPCASGAWMIYLASKGI